MKLALVYDRVNKFGGAERVLLALHEIWPEAPLYTSVYSPKGAAWAKDFKIVPSFLNNLPLARTRHEYFPWLMPLAFESFEFDEFDIVISITSEFAKGIITKPETLHLCYCLTPTRYLWSGYEDYFPTPASQLVSRPMVSYLRSWDKVASQRPDALLAISKEVKKRIKKYYHRQAGVVYPGVDTTFFKPARQRKKGQYFLIVSRLVPYKRVDIAIQAFNRLGLPLKIIGDGLNRAGLERVAQPNIEFLGQRLTDKQLIKYYQNCRALIFAGSEDLGLASLEAQACGKPAIAFRGGGVPESLVPGKTGELFYPKTAAALAAAVKKFEEKKYQPEACRQQGQKFDVKIFKKQFQEWVEQKWQQHSQNQKPK